MGVQNGSKRLKSAVTGLLIVAGSIEYATN